MRAVAVSVWIFINLVFVGMCGYIYLLWSQYWQYVERQQEHMAGLISSARVSGGGSGQVFYYYNHDSMSTTDPNLLSNSSRASTLPKHRSSDRANNRTSVGQKMIRRRNSQPRFPKLRGAGAGADESRCASDRASSRVLAHKSQLVVQLRRVLLEESSVFKARGEGNNPYNVQYAGPRGSYVGKNVQQLVCALRHKVGSMHTVGSQDEPFRSLGLGQLFPETPIFMDKYNTCAIVTNAGSLFGSGLGTFIDMHDMVLRFNHAPTTGYEADVGTKTTLRIVNSQVVSKPSFNFMTSPLYQNVILLAWDPSNYSSTLEEWYRQPDFDVFTPYFQHRKLHPKQAFYLLDPRSQWTLWDWIQSLIPVRIRKNPPSSGFLGLALMLPHCLHVDLFEYVPSIRLTKRCHYWDVAEDSSCTFGVWHPLAAEKLLALALNVASDQTVFSNGYVRVPGYDILQC
ncbi:beta-galactoside alpha-2,6-sialyltransferase 2 [Periplaneta americana]|uniref:beta-galactoside alpha-2,6-sialyltransferase 2 n=1 Tax=Periplaneta americana TaxID=6978 RepID=UPI0037E92E72